MGRRTLEILEGIQGILRTRTSAGANVFIARPGPVWELEAPALALYAEDEEAEPLEGDEKAPLSYRVEQTIAVEPMVRGAGEISGRPFSPEVILALHGLLEQVRAALLPRPELDGIVSYGRWLRTEHGLTNFGVTITGGARMLFAYGWDEDADPFDNLAEDPASPWLRTTATMAPQGAPDGAPATEVLIGEPATPPAVPLPAALGLASPPAL